MNYFSRGLSIYPHWHLQLSSGGFYYVEKFAFSYSVGRIHKIHLKCLVLIASPCGSCFVEPDTIVSVQTFYVGSILNHVNIYLSTEWVFNQKKKPPFWDWCFLLWSDPLKLFAKFFRGNTTDLAGKNQSHYKDILSLLYNI